MGMLQPDGIKLPGVKRDNMVGMTSDTFNGVIDFKRESPRTFWLRGVVVRFGDTRLKRPRLYSEIRSE